MLTTLYKLTDADDRTYHGCQWGENVQHVTSGKGESCTPGWTHWYTDPLLAIMLNVVHGNFDPTTAHMWEGEGTVVLNVNGTKVGCADGRTIRRIDLPLMTPEQRVRYAIFCALETQRNPIWRRWAKGWLSGADRSAKAANTVKVPTTASQGAASAFAVLAASVYADLVTELAMRTFGKAARIAFANTTVEEGAAMAVVWAARSKAIDLVALIHKAVV